jgi:pyrrolysyl-tRNA synthetase-like protein
LMLGWTTTQKQRLKELSAPVELQNKTFMSSAARDEDFLNAVQELIKRNKKDLKKKTSELHRPLTCKMEYVLIDTLIKNSFTQVFTPLFISKSALAKMSIDEHHALYQDIFWIDKNKCLRPMLAPNLYQMLYNFGRLLDRPIRIFEVGPCFRKDSGGRYHLSEFTMLNLVEMGSEQKSAKERLNELAAMIIGACGIDNYSLSNNRCDVYGDTVDVIVKDIEVASAVIGPHPLDSKWKINEPWIGIGFGLERLALVKGVHYNIQRIGRSLAYFDGIRLNI